jgi:type I restriction enzyme S subunit
MKETKFKQTEVGMIPRDWEVIKLCDLCYLITKQTGFDYSAAIKPSLVRNSSSYTLPFIQNKDFEGTKINFETDFYIPKSVAINYPKILLNEPVLLISISGRIGNVAYFSHQKDAFIGGAVGVARFNDKRLIEWTNLYLQSVDGQTQIFANEKSGAQHNLTIADVRNLKIAFPKKIEEQQRVANALSDVDTLINNLEKLIAKKKNIKQGAMQQLLTGRKRLPGFGSDERRKACHSERSAKREESNGYKMTELGLIPIDWEVKNVGKLLKIGHGRDYKNLKSGNVPVYGTGGYMTSVNDYLYEGETVCIGRKGTIDKPFYHTGKIWTVDTLFYTYGFNGCIPKFIYYAFCLVDWFAMNEASGVPSLTSKNIEDVLLRIPVSKDEQTAIANVLSDMDTEISALETKLAKYRTLKTGMMQQLLTGKIRLVDAKLETKSVENNRVVPVAFKRAVLAAEIAHRLCAEPTFGHVKMEKMLFLAEKMCELDINSSYHRDAAGPYDNRALRSVDSQLEKQKWFKFIRSDKGNHYIPLEKRGGHSQYFERYYSECRSVFDSIISTFKTAKTEQCEIVATLYSAWEDFLNQGADPTDDQIVTEVLTNWNESKKRISRDRWMKALLWMKENKFTPLKQVL